MTNLLNILHLVGAGELSPEEAAGRMRFTPFEELLNGVNLDLHRELRTGRGECVLAQDKSQDRLLAAMRGLAGPEGSLPVLATRVSEVQGKGLSREFPQGEWSREAGLFTLNRYLRLSPPWPRNGELMIVTAGASDMRVALEALGTARFCGLDCGLAPDIGVAGLHRMTPWLEAFAQAKLLMVIAGMEGALPSVIAGLTGKPVLAVPTSVGYGVSAGGFAALAGMLSSCAAGISVFNIDNGYGATVFADRVLRASTG
ncbi:MAG: nickel pincer cofactor biosynthesis protein LarB [Desulfovibrionaceae bacterium]|nr:nickel pincer cofactor biosynthesis protein LarB [Desulfovibrionaceae bacterium]